jgi:hypothetical protein
MKIRGGSGMSIVGLFHFVLIIAASGVFGAEPLVSNVTMLQQADGSKIAVITYDLEDADGDTLAVALSISNDGGISWNVPCRSLTGDVGLGVLPGIGKSIYWDLGYDFPDMDGSSFQARVVASDAGVLHRTHSPDNYWIMEWSDVDWADDQNIEKIAKGDVAVLGLYSLYSNIETEIPAFERIHNINPDIKLLGYYLNKTNMLWWANTPEGSITRTLYDRTEPYWAYTTTGDTLMNWPGQVVLNILDRQCREAIYNTLAEFRSNSINQFDGVLWDYFDMSIWIHPDVAPFVDGDPDFDGDGIGMYDDADEREAYLAACDSLVIETRQVLGDNFIQVFNGTRACTDQDFARLGDGMYYEIFPTQIFPDPDFANALNPNYENSLFNAVTWPRSENGGPYIVIGSYRHSLFYDFNGEWTEINYGNMFRVAGLLTGVYTTWLTTTNHNYHWTDNELNLGLPTGPTVIDGVHFSREFQYGRIELTMETGASPKPCSYVVYINGVVVEEFDPPYHFP